MQRIYMHAYIYIYIYTFVENFIIIIIARHNTTEIVCTASHVQMYMHIYVCTYHSASYIVK